MAIAGRIDPAPNHDGRAERRELLLETSGELGGVPANVTVHNISATGLLIETAQDLGVGEGLRITLPEAGAVDAEVVWASGTLRGCRFAEPIGRAVLSAAQLRSVVAPAAQAPTEASDGPAQIAGSTLGQRIAAARQARHWSLAQVAAALGVSRPTVWAWEHDRARPAGSRMTALATVLGVEPESLAGAGDTIGVSADLAKLADSSRQRIAAAAGVRPERVRILIEL